MENIFFWDGEFNLGFEGILTLKKVIMEKDIRLVVIDPIVSFLGPRVNMNSATDIRGALSPLVRLMKEVSASAIIIRHFNKDHLGIASHRGAGSVDIRNIARSVF